MSSIENIFSQLGMWDQRTLEFDTENEKYDFDRDAIRFSATEMPANKMSSQRRSIG